MGWWSTDVMGGDSPLDCLGDLADAAGVKFNFGPDNPGDVFGYALTATQVAGLAPRAPELTAGYGPIGGQVYGWLALHFAVPLTSETRAWILDCVKRDEWAAEGDDDRIATLASFAERIAAAP